VGIYVTAIQKRKQACRDTFLSLSFGTHTKRSYSVLVGIIPSAAGNLISGIRLVLHVMVNFVAISGATVASAIIRDEILEFVAVMGGFCCAQQTGMHKLGCGSTACSVGTVYEGKGHLYTPENLIQP
jgi:hypothetical protein